MWTDGLHWNCVTVGDGPEQVTVSRDEEVESMSCEPTLDSGNMQLVDRSVDLFVSLSV